jgi:hypothetical protein
MRFRAISLIDFVVLRARYRIIGIALGGGILPDDGSAGVFLSGEMFELCDSREGLIVGIVDSSDSLKLLHLPKMLDAQNGVDR